jgi:hypothetical protein
MSKINVPLILVSVRRDANTITPVTVPPHELTILRSIFGKENVQEVEQAGAVEIDATEEHNRLSAKYGSQRVAKIYGDDGGDRLVELVERTEIKADKQSKKAKADEPTEA